MRDRTWTSAGCPVARTIDLVGDKWSLLIIRDAFDGIRRFGQFQRNLGVAKNILSDRLSNLVDAGVLTVQPASDGTSYREYVLTDRGTDLFSLVISLRQWGQDHAYEPGEKHVTLVDRATGEPTPRLTYTTPGGHAISADETLVRKFDAVVPGLESRARFGDSVVLSHGSEPLIAARPVLKNDRRRDERQPEHEEYQGAEVPEQDNDRAEHRQRDPCVGPSRQLPAQDQEHRADDYGHRCHHQDDWVPATHTSADLRERGQPAQYPQDAQREPQP